MVGRFFRQPNRAYRTMQLVVGAIGVHLALVALAILVVPLALVGQFRALGGLFGQFYAVGEFGHLWRILAAANVATLAFVCFSIQTNVRRFGAMVGPFAFMTTVGALGFASVALVGRFASWSMLGYAYLPFLALAAWLAFCGAAVWWTVRAARRSIDAGGDAAVATLVPRLRWVNNP